MCERSDFMYLPDNKGKADEMSCARVDQNTNKGFLPKSCW